jgi:hypothetical protein
MKLRKLRDGAMPGAGVLLVRGGELDSEVLRADALRYHSVYGSYGISVFAIHGVTLDEMLQQVPLVRFERLALIRVASIIEAGLRLEPTGRNLFHYTIGFDDLRKGVLRLASCAHQIVPNPFYDA